MYNVPKKYLFGKVNFEESQQMKQMYEKIPNMQRFFFEPALVPKATDMIDILHKTVIVNYPICLLTIAEISWH